jgi:hypothetical protein
MRSFRPPHSRSGRAEGLDRSTSPSRRPSSRPSLLGSTWTKIDRMARPIPEIRDPAGGVDSVPDPTSACPPNGRSLRVAGGWNRRSAPPAQRRGADPCGRAPPGPGPLRQRERPLWAALKV